MCCFHPLSGLGGVGKNVCTSYNTHWYRSVAVRNLLISIRFLIPNKVKKTLSTSKILEKEKKNYEEERERNIAFIILDYTCIFLSDGWYQYTWRRGGYFPLPAWTANHTSSRSLRITFRMLSISRFTFCLISRTSSVCVCVVPCITNSRFFSTHV